jgi:Domain of unknown function (DUF6378)
MTARPVRPDRPASPVRPFAVFAIPDDAFKTSRQLTLEAAAECVLKNRCDAYGPPEDSFSDIAVGWSVIAGTEITAAQVGLMMVWLKTVRAKENPGQMDNYVDGAGYFACAAECADSDPDSP